MRELLFRGRTKDGTEWHYGDLIHGKLGRTYILENHSDLVEVEPDSIGQYIGINDNYERKIFEGDLVSNGYRESEVSFCIEDVASCGCCVPYFVGVGFKAYKMSLFECSVAGNVYDRKIEENIKMKNFEKQFREIKGKFPENSILLFKIGDYLEAYFEDARKISRFSGWSSECIYYTKNGVDKAIVPYSEKGNLEEFLNEFEYRFAIIEERESL